MAYTACGRFDAFWEKGLCPWDKAAGAVIAKEAGATLNDFSGGEFSVYGNETLVTNGNLLSQMIDLLKI
jgi:myo-inositol-1(or 4)-monophosphatase